MLKHVKTMLRHVKATITAPNTAAAAELVNNPNKKVIFKN